MRILFIVISASLVFGQESTDDVINTIFKTNTTFADFLDGYEEVTPPPLKSIGALSKCGQGSQKNLFVCVPYYNCNSETKTVDANPDFDGTNKIDIRMGEEEEHGCGHYLEICCRLPDDGRIPPVTPPTRPNTGGGSEDPGTGGSGTGGSGTGGSGTGGSVTGSSGTGGSGTGSSGTGGSGTGSSGTGGSGTGGSGTGGSGTGGGNSTTRVNCGVRNAQGLDFNLIGGTNEANFGEFPWMVAILRKNPGNQKLSVCGGSLIGPRVVLTGAHCVQNLDVSAIKIRAGEWDTQTQNERIPFQERNVVQKIVHEYYTKGNLYNDVALLILDRQLAKTDSIGTVCLPQNKQHFNARECFATGWGKDSFGEKGRDVVILKKIQMPLVMNSDCQRALKKTRLGPSFTLHRSFICAGGEPNLDTCTGDGGSPLVCPDPQNPNRYLQVGIVAWGIGCGENQVPGVYADVANFRNWIDERLQEVEISPVSYVQ